MIPSMQNSPNRITNQTATFAKLDMLFVLSFRGRFLHPYGTDVSNGFLVLAQAPVVYPSRDKIQLLMTASANHANTLFGNRSGRRCGVASRSRCGDNLRL